jgi:hypothetical protein
LPGKTLAEEEVVKSLGRKKVDQMVKIYNKQQKQADKIVFFSFNKKKNAKK